MGAVGCGVQAFSVPDGTEGHVLVGAGGRSRGAGRGVGVRLRGRLTVGPLVLVRNPARAGCRRVRGDRGRADYGGGKAVPVISGKKTTGYACGGWVVPPGRV